MLADLKMVRQAEGSQAAEIPVRQEERFPAPMNAFGSEKSGLYLLL